MADITISAEPRKTFTVDLVGKTYTIRAPKGSAAIALASRANMTSKRGKGGDAAEIEGMLSMLRDWSRAAFGVKVAEEVLARLDDPEDDLDFQHLSDLMAKVSEASTGNPTTSS